MKEITKSEAKEIQLSLLNLLDTLCREHDLRYSLYGGTLLGAVRHKGYIPWDDDIDVIMPREDYETLRAHFAEWVHPDYIHLQDYRTNPYYYFPFIKLSDERTILQSARKFEHTIGIDLDIFPLDGMPRHKWTALPWLWMSHFLRKCQSMAIREGWLVKKEAWYERPARCLFRVLTLGCGPLFFCRLQDKFATLYQWDKSRWATNVLWMDNIKDGGKKNMVPVNYYGPPFSTILFEGKMYQSVADSHHLLSMLYKDYMTLPPVEARTNVHLFGMWWKDAYTPR